MTFDNEQRAMLARLADVLIPAGAGMPSASQADVAGTGLDKVLAARPELADALLSLLRGALGREPGEFVAQLQSGDVAAFGALAEFVPAAYFMNPDVRRAIGYDGQGPRPIDPRPDYMEHGLLESVILRGPIYRPTPQT